jgi:hypothetical protein
VKAESLNINCNFRILEEDFCSPYFSLLHNYAPAQKLQVFANFYPKMLNTFSPPYSPDKSPPGYCLFSKLKIMLKELHFADVTEIQAAVSDELK